MPSIEEQIREAARAGQSQTKLVTEYANKPLGLGEIDEAEAQRRTLAIMGFFAQTQPQPQHQPQPQPRDSLPEVTQPEPATDEQPPLECYFEEQPQQPEPQEPAQEAPRIPLWTWAQIENPPKPNPPLIHGVVRREHVVGIIGKQKSTKSWSLANACVAVAVGSKWFDFECERGYAMYVDPECDTKTMERRINRIARGRGISPSEVQGRIAKWTLRGSTTVDGGQVTVSELAKELERELSTGELERGKFSLICVDTLNSLIGGDSDENSSLAVRQLFNTFNRIATATGAAILFAHHAGKAADGDKSAADRARGSSVFADAPDALLSLVQLVPPNGDAEESLGKGKTALAVECAGLREFPSFDTRHFLFGFVDGLPKWERDRCGLTTGWKPRSSSQRGGKASGASRQLKSDLQAARCEAALLAHFLSEGIGSEGVTAKEAAEVCARALERDSVPTTSVKRWLTNSTLVRTEQVGARRVRFAPIIAPSEEAGEEEEGEQQQLPT